MARTGGAPLPTITPDSALGGMVIERSLRFNGSDSAYLTRTPSSASNRRTFTFSCWVKRGDIGRGEYRSMFSARQSSTTNLDYFLWWNTDEVAFSNFNQTDYNVRTTQKFRDPNAWYHLVLAIDSTQGTAANRVKIYVNGSEVTDFGASSYPSQNYDFQLNNNQPQYIGYNTFNYMDGYMTEINFVDGSQLDASYFGYTEFQTGIWRPKRYEGTYGTNGFYLDFSDNSSTTTLGIDKSPKGNDFTLNNFSVSAGIDNDSFTDTPTSENIFAQLNSALPRDSGAQYRNGNYTFYMTHSGNHMRASSNMPVNSGKWYAEFKLTTYSFQSGSYPYIGVCADDLWINSWTGDAGTAYQTGGTIWRNGSSISSGHSTYTQGDTISVAIDLDQGTPKIWWAKNGTYINSGNPATNANGTDIAPTSPTGYYNFAMSLWASTGQWDANFGQRAFSYDIPSGFKTLCTDNVRSTQNIRPQKHFDTITYTGTDTSAARTITGLEFTPDLIWQKRRNGENWNTWHDTVRGVGKTLYSNGSGNSGSSGQTTNNQYGYISAFGTNGFTWSPGTTNNSDGNETNGTFASWCWKAGGAAVSNSDGSVTSSVSANQEAGFSIVKWTTQSGAYTVGHGLGRTPEMIMSVHLSNTGTSWPTFTTVVDGTMDYGYISANSTWTDAVQYGIDVPNSTTFQGHSNFHASSGDCIAYCWASIPGYSKIGMYKGNGNADGTYVHLGFRPALVMMKNTTTQKHWGLFDNKRSGFNVENYALFPSDKSVEDTSDYIDFLSNGFKLRSTALFLNKDGDNMIYMAFADQTDLTAFDQVNPNAR